MRRLRLLVSAVAVGLAPLLGPSPTAAAGGLAFTNFQLGGLPAEYCPDPNSPCQNFAAEPNIRADGFGNFFAASENGLSSGTEAWKSVDGGRHYVHLPSPNQLANPLVSNTSTAGGDVDVATAPVKNAYGIYNVYVSSLELSSVYVSTSSDGGHTWAANPVSSVVPGNDREWIAADGQNKVCISYHDLATFNINVDCSYTAGSAGGFTQHGSAIDVAHAPYQLQNNSIGNLVIDQRSNLADPARNSDIVYQSYTACPYSAAQNASDYANCTANATYHGVFMGVSTDGGRTFTDYPVYINPDGNVSYGHQFPNTSVDSSGNVYVFYSDNRNLLYSYSRDHGQTWHGPFQVNKPPANTAIMPWSAAGDAGKIDVVWYGTSYTSPGVAPDSYPNSAAWYVYFAQNRNVFGSPTGFTQVQASPINHYGGVCEGGVGCTGNRDLYDDFGVAVSPTTGLASIVYSDDQYDQYNHTLTYPTSCTAAKNNTSSCDHTSIATQIGGPGIIGGGVGGGGGGGGVTSCQQTPDSSRAEADAVLAINAQRLAAGLPALAVNSTAADTARKHSCDERAHGDPSERGSDGSLPAQRLAAAGLSFSRAAENIGLAVGPSASAALGSIQTTLLTDAAAKAKILDPTTRQIGIGAVYADGVMWLTEDFLG